MALVMDNYVGCNRVSRACRDIRLRSNGTNT